MSAVVQTCSDNHRDCTGHDQVVDFLAQRTESLPPGTTSGIIENGSNKIFREERYQPTSKVSAVTDETGDDLVDAGSVPDLDDCKAVIAHIRKLLIPKEIQHRACKLYMDSYTDWRSGLIDQPPNLGAIVSTASNEIRHEGTKFLVDSHFRDELDVHVSESANNNLVKEKDRSNAWRSLGRSPQAAEMEIMRSKISSLESEVADKDHHFTCLQAQVQVRFTQIYMITLTDYDVR